MIRYNLFRKVSLLSKEQHDAHLKNTKSLLDSIRHNFESIPSKPVKPVSQPAQISRILPEDPVSFSEILNTVEKCIYPNILQWQHPMFFSYFPSLISWESIQGAIMAKSMGAVCFTKESCPVANDIEMCVTDWLAEMLQLPNKFFHSKGPGGGITYGSSTEGILTAMSVARMRRPNLNNVVYTSDQSNFVVTKAARILGLKIRIIPAVYDPNKNDYPINVYALKEQIAKDKKQGLTPAFISAIVGGTNVAANDDVKALGEIAANEHIWLHVDAAYAGYYCIVPEMRYLLDGMDNVTSINMNNGKMLLSGIGHSILWVKDWKLLTDCLAEEAHYFKTNLDVDSKDRHMFLSRDCKAMSIWFIMQQVGAKGLRAYIRKNIEAGKLMEKMLLADGRFEIVNGVRYGLVPFRVKGDNEKTDVLISSLMERNDISILGSHFHGQSIIRFSPASIYEDFSNVKEAFGMICSSLEENYKVDGQLTRQKS